jgi:hypothetical protein
MYHQQSVFKCSLDTARRPEGFLKISEHLEFGPYMYSGKEKTIDMNRDLLIQTIIGIVIQMYGIPVIIHITIEGTIYTIDFTR